MMRNFLIREHKVLRVMVLRYFVTYKLLSTHALCKVTGCNVFTVMPLVFHKGLQQSSDPTSSVIKQQIDRCSRLRSPQQLLASGSSFAQVLEQETSLHASFEPIFFLSGFLCLTLNQIRRQIFVFKNFYRTNMFCPKKRY